MRMATTEQAERTGVESLNLFTLWKGCNPCIGTKSAFCAVHIVNVMASNAVFRQQHQQRQTRI